MLEAKDKLNSHSNVASVKIIFLSLGLIVGGLIGWGVGEWMKGNETQEEISKLKSEKTQLQSELTTAYQKIREQLATPTSNDESTDSRSGSASMTASQRNALASAKSYLSTSMSFSYSGLIKQLEYEKYSYEDAVYAADNCGADWNAQAAKSAKSYAGLMSFSRDGLIEQLMFEGFTYDQAAYGATQAGL